MLKLCTLLLFFVGLCNCSHEDYYKEGEDCLTNFECRSTTCCKDYKCVESSECKTDVKKTYIIVGVIAIVFLILVIIYFGMSIRDTRKSVNEIQSLNLAMAEQQKKDEARTSKFHKENRNSINNQKLDNIK